MTQDTQILKKLNLAGKVASSQGDDTMEGAAVMNDPRYLRQSSALINDALQKGFDVLQMANGDIVTTGTKIVVSTYSWDDSKGKLVKARTGSRAARMTQAPMEDAE